MVLLRPNPAALSEHDTLTQYGQKGGFVAPQGADADPNNLAALITWSTR